VNNKILAIHSTGRSNQSRTSLKLVIAIVGGLSAVTGCGSGTTDPAIEGTMTPAAVVAPAISIQPMDRSVPMGLTATFSVTATGSLPQYQWTKNGATIPGAVSSTYVTLPVALGDAGANFLVSVSNSAATISTAGSRTRLPSTKRRS
jgi:hypothetical protein